MSDCLVCGVQPAESGVDMDTKRMIAIFVRPFMMNDFNLYFTDEYIISFVGSAVGIFPSSEQRRKNPRDLTWEEFENIQTCPGLCRNSLRVACWARFCSNGRFSFVYSMRWNS
jgi:hypothetical protein